MPRRTKRPTAQLEPTEQQIHIAVVAHLRARARKDIVWFHTANEGKKSKAEAAKHKAMGLTAGIPDLILISDGKTYGLELKRDKGRLSKEQEHMLDAFRRAGAHTAVAYGLDNALSYLTSWGVFAPKQPAAFRAAHAIAA